MSDPITPDDPPDMAAAELALGLLDGDERAAALRRVLAEPAFAGEVERWRGHFSGLFDLWPEAEPPADGLARLEYALDTVSNDIAPRIRAWPALAAASSLIAACLLLFIMLRPPATAIQITRAEATPLLVAAIAPSAGGTPAAAVYDPRIGRLIVTFAQLADAEHSSELWVIGKDAVPHSLGVMTLHGATARTLSPADRARFAAGALIAVTVEPLGGSPSGKPTGPIVAKGELTLA